MVPSRDAVRLSLHPAFPFRIPVYLHPSCMLLSQSLSRSRPGGSTPCMHRRASDFIALPQGSSLQSGLCCPGLSSLNRPHPTHSQAHRDFTVQRLIPDAFAVRVRLSSPRVVPSFHCTFLLGMSPSKTPGSPPAAYTQFLHRRR